MCVNGAAVMCVNANGEVKGVNPIWACEDFGATDHNYYLCPACVENFAIWIKNPTRYAVEKAVENPAD